MHEILQKLDAQVKQKYPPTPEMLKRHPSMHRTDTLDGAVTLSNKEGENSASRTFSSDPDCRAPRVYSRRTKGSVCSG
jgi:hypothetical protein